MNAPFAPPGAAWQEHRTPDGRVYYYNALTKVTQWTKPEDLMSPAEVWPPGISAGFFCVLTLSEPARARESALERVHGRGRSQVLVQYRDEAELVGDTGCVQASSGWRRGNPDNTSVSTLRTLPPA
jgi:hypothetical protein